MIRREHRSDSFLPASFLNMARLKLAPLCVVYLAGACICNAAAGEDIGSTIVQLKADLARINQAGIPTDIVFEQGRKTLGLGNSAFIE